MKKLKTVLISTLVVILMVIAFCGTYCKGYYSYAVNDDGTLTNDELDIAIHSWLESHGGNLFSPSNYRARKSYEAGLIHNFIFGGANGYDDVRQHIHGGVGGNNELQFNFDGYILDKLNTWLNLKLQDGSFGNDVTLNEDGMFDTGINNTLYNGEYLNYCGYDCLVYNVTATGYISSDKVLSFGSTYRYYTDNVFSSLNYANGSETAITFDYYDSNHSLTVKNVYAFLSVDTSDKYELRINKYSNNSNWIGTIKSNKTLNTMNGNFCIYKYNGNYFIGTFSKIENASLATWNYHVGNIVAIFFPQDVEPDNVVIVFNTNNNNNVSVYPSIDYNDVDGKLYITPKVDVGVNGEVNYQPYIVNENNTINNVINNYYQDSNTPDKTISEPSDSPSTPNTPPIGGNDPNWDNPYPNLTPDGDGGFNFNFNLPDLNIDWNISGLKEKFPFSIPFDLISFVRVLDAEPETPEFTGTINLIIYQWEIDADLSAFDNLASIVRNVEFIGFCITLILITRKMIKG